MPLTLAEKLNRQGITNHAASLIADAIDMSASGIEAIEQDIAQIEAEISDLGDRVEQLEESGDIPIVTPLLISVPGIGDCAVVTLDSEDRCIAAIDSQGGAWIVQNGALTPLSGKNPTVYLAATGGYSLPADENTLHLFPMFGQSLALGICGDPSATALSVSPEFPGYVLGLDPGFWVNGRASASITNLVGQNYNGSFEGFGPAFANTVQRLFQEKFSVNRRVGTFTAGSSNTLYTGIRRGTAAYSELLRCIDLWRDLASQSGWEVVIPCVVFAHGESDGLAETPIYVYEAAIRQFRSDLQDDVRLMLGQKTDIRIMTYVNADAVGLPSRSLVVWRKLGLIIET